MFDNQTRVEKQTLFKSFNFYFTALNLLSYIVYFIIVLSNRQLRRISYFQIHHVNFVGLLISLLAMVWSVEMFPFKENRLSRSVCFLFEILWACLKYIRVHAVLILAVYRYVAAFKLGLFKRIKKSLRCTLFIALLGWILPFLWFLLAKYSTLTVSDSTCIDGYNTKKILGIVYQSVTFILGFLFPTIFVIYFSILIHIKVLNSYKKVSTIKSLPLFNNKGARFKKEYFFIIQLYLVNTLEILIFIFMIILYIASQTSGMFNNLQFSIMNTMPMFLSTCIPIITLSSICINCRHHKSAANN